VHDFDFLPEFFYLAALEGLILAAKRSERECFSPFN
jgi:hypothetical protein